MSHLRRSGGGIARYVRGIAGALQERADIRLVEIGSGSHAPRSGIRRKLLTAELDLAWYPAIARKQAARAGADILHCPEPRGPLRRGKPPVVVTLHDLVPFHFPETMSRWSLLYARATHRAVLLAADRIICNSTDTADDLVRVLAETRDRLRIIPLGVDAAFFHPRAPQEKAEEPYILFVGTQELRKNLSRLQKAVGILRGRGFPHTLLVAGGGNSSKVQLDAPFVRVIRTVTDDDLRRLYAGAACLALPSLHEGFGLTALEAMAAGTPVVASRAGALPETTGGAAVLVDPLDPQDIARGLETAITDPARWREAGARRAALFTWERSAEATLRVYRELA